MLQWPETIDDARKTQQKLRYEVKITGLTKTPEYIAGVDAAFSEGHIIGAVCLFRYPDLIMLEEAYAVTKAAFPYIPGFLSFREGPAIIRAINNLKIRPDIILFDGQGIAHPQGLGIASHIGVLLNTPSIGCAKSRLVGSCTEPGVQKGEYASLKYHGKMIGAVLRTKSNVKPIFVSPGHMIDLRGAIDIVLKCTGNYRIPEPLRCADRLSKRLKAFGLNFGL